MDGLVQATVPPPPEQEMAPTSEEGLMQDQAEVAVTLPPPLADLETSLVPLPVDALVGASQAGMSTSLPPSNPLSIILCLSLLSSVLPGRSSMICQF